MNTNIPERTFLSALSTLRIDKNTHSQSLRSRILMHVLIFVFGVLSGIATLIYLAIGPMPDQQTKAVIAFIILGSLTLCILSSTRLFTLLIAAYAHEKIERLIAENMEEDVIDNTGRIARQILIGNLSNPEFRKDLSNFIDNKNKDDDVSLEISSHVFEESFSYENVAKAINDLEFTKAPRYTGSK